MKRAYIDIETYSRTPIKNGVSAYSEGGFPLVCAVAYDDEKTRVWRIDSGAPLSDFLRSALRDIDTLIAHNAQFEHAFLNPYYAGAWQCTSAWALACALPGALGALCAALQIDEGKLEGAHYIKRFCIPSRTCSVTNGVYRHTDAAGFAEFTEYCVRDAEVLRVVCDRLARISPFPRALYNTDLQMNARGFEVDANFADLAAAYAGQLSERASEKVKRLTGLSATQNKALAAHMGVKSLAAAEVQRMLNDDATPAHVIDILSARADAAQSSLAKFSAVARVKSSDSRIRYGFRLFGAPRTGRHSARLFQAQNLPRQPKGFTYDPNVLAGDFGDMAAKDLVPYVRGVIRAGMVGDFSNIEARVLRWLCYCANGLAAFELQDSGGADVYQAAADKFGGTRQEGKVAELALGYQGGPNALGLMAAAYGLELSVERKEAIVNLWRANNPAVVNFWRDIESAFKRCVGNNGVRIGVGRLTVCGGARSVFIVLPSGRRLIYWRAELRGGSLSYHNYARRRLPRVDTYGGKLTENVCQAIVADFLNGALVNADGYGLQPIAVVHDEIVCDAADTAMLKRVMEARPAWAQDFPLRADVKVLPGGRYGK